MTATPKPKGKTPKRPDPMGDLVANAIDFLTLATEEFEGRPKHSIIAFHSAVELVLKARLMHEHWSLVVGKNPDLSSFQTGDFVSVTFEEACQRLAKVVGSALPDQTRRWFDEIRKHRNKLVHFFQDIDTPAVREQIAREQLSAWHGLVGLLRVQWRDVFARFDIDIDALDRRFAKHRLYLHTRFDSLSDELKALKAAGKTIETCRSCGFDAAETQELVGELRQAKCHVCRIAPRWLTVECPKCEKPMQVEGDDGATCEACQTGYDQDELSDLIDEDPVTTDNYFDHATPAHCSSCDGYQTVVSYRDHYLCVSCLELTDGLGACGWCGESNNGDMEDSEWKGCNFCDGRKGWDRD